MRTHTFEEFHNATLRIWIPPLQLKFLPCDNFSFINSTIKVMFLETLTIKIL